MNHEPRTDCWCQPEIIHIQASDAFIRANPDWQGEDIVEIKHKERKKTHRSWRWIYEGEEDE